MGKFRLRKPSPALVISLVALMVALGGTSYAAFRLAPNSVGTAQLKNNAVTTPKIRNAAVTAVKINPAGLNPSNYTQSSTAQTLTTTVATVGAPIQITTRGSRRIIASGVVHATNGVSGQGDYLVCHLTIDGTSGNNDTAYASPHDSPAPSGQFTIVDASVSPLASAVVGPGAHTVTMLCSAAGLSTASMKVADDALTGWTVSP